MQQNPLQAPCGHIAAERRNTGDLNLLLPTDYWSGVRQFAHQTRWSRDPDREMRKPADRGRPSWRHHDTVRWMETHALRRQASCAAQCRARENTGWFALGRPGRRRFRWQNETLPHWKNDIGPAVEEERACRERPGRKPGAFEIADGHGDLADLVKKHRGLENRLCASFLSPAVRGVLTSSVQSCTLAGISMETSVPRPGLLTTR